MKKSRLFTLILVIIFAILSISTLTACGKPFTVTFDGNGGFLLSEDVEEVQTVKKASKLKAPVYGRYGYDQVGWDVELSSIKTDTTVKAVWQVTKYKIIYDLAGGIETESNQREYTIEDEDITLFAPQKTGYEFIGWTGTGYTSATKNVTIPSGSYGNKTFTANWIVKNYNISYNLNLGELTSANPSTYNILSVDQHISNPTRTGYDFIGWTGTGLTEPTTAVVIRTGSHGDREYTANWEAMKFNVNFDLNGGKIDGSDTIDPKVVSYDSKIGELPIPELEGKVFDGWYLGDERISSSMVYNFTEDISLTARYADYYTVKFILKSKVGSVEVACLYDGKTEKEDEHVYPNGKLENLVNAQPSGRYSDDYDFDCWVYVSEDGNEVVITKDTVFTKDIFTHSTVYIIAKCKAGPWTPIIPA